MIGLDEVNRKSLGAVKGCGMSDNFSDPPQNWLYVSQAGLSTNTLTCEGRPRPACDRLCQRDRRVYLKG
jgi:hypothetical protein